MSPTALPEISTLVHGTDELALQRNDRLLFELPSNHISQTAHEVTRKNIDAMDMNTNRCDQIQQNKLLMFLYIM